MIFPREKLWKVPGSTSTDLCGFNFDFDFDAAALQTADCREMEKNQKKSVEGRKAEATSQEAAPAAAFVLIGKIRKHEMLGCICRLAG